MNEYWIVSGIVVVYVLAAYYLSRLAESKEIGVKKLFILSLLLTPVIGVALYISSPHRKIFKYKEEFYKCKTCGYTFSEDHGDCPFCKKDGIDSKLVPTQKLMT